MQIQTSQALLK